MYFDPVDIDECAAMQYQCDSSADCINIEGSYQCKCRKGFLGDGKSCNRQYIIVKLKWID